MNGDGCPLCGGPRFPEEERKRLSQLLASTEAREEYGIQMREKFQECREKLHRAQAKIGTLMASAAAYRAKMLDSGMEADDSIGQDAIERWREMERAVALLPEIEQLTAEREQVKSEILELRERKRRGILTLEDEGQWFNEALTRERDEARAAANRLTADLAQARSDIRQLRSGDWSTGDGPGTKADRDRLVAERDKALHDLAALREKVDGMFAAIGGIVSTAGKP